MLQNEELHSLYTSASVIRLVKWRMMRSVEYVTQIWEKKNAYRLLVGKPELFEIPKRRWMVDVKIDFGEIEWGWYGLD
jgi:hypothetical protein